jgi:NADH-quinone oxidoreductase subunit E
MLSDSGKRKIATLRTMYPQRQSALLPALYLAQDEYGYLPNEAIDEVAQLLDVPPAEVESVASFYSMFYRRRVGANIIRLCTNMSCHLWGADTVATYVAKKLGIGDGQTTADGKITLELVECLGACDQAPVMLVNDHLYGNLTLERVDEILDEVQKEGTPINAERVADAR